MSLFASKRLRIVQAGYENYTGPIGAYEFVDGVSVETIPLIARDRLAVAFQLVEIEDDGTEVAAGPAQRLLKGLNLALEPSAPGQRQTEEEKLEENVRALLGGELVRVLRTRSNLEAVADKMGIAGVRLVADPWGVRSKSIPALIDLILGAQLEYMERRVDALVKHGASEADARELFSLRDDVPMPETEQDAKARELTQVAAITSPATEVHNEKQPEPAVEPSVVDAAEAGDLSSALNLE